MGWRPHGAGDVHGTGYGTGAAVRGPAPSTPHHHADVCPAGDRGDLGRELRQLPARARTAAGRQGGPRRAGPPRQGGVCCSVGAPCGGCGCTATSVCSSAPPGTRRLIWRPWAEGRSRRPGPPGATGPGPRREGPPWISRPGRGAWKAWYSWASRLGWGCGRGRKARRKGEPGGRAGGPGKWGREELDSPQTQPPPCFLHIRENGERKENVGNR